MTPRFAVRTTPLFDRLLRRLSHQHPELVPLYARALGILETDPVNVGRQHNILKLAAVPAGEGQYRLALGRFRFRYDIYGQEVVLQRCSLRREDTYD